MADTSQAAAGRKPIRPVCMADTGLYAWLIRACLSTNSCIVESDYCWWILSEEEASERAKRAAAAARRW